MMNWFDPCDQSAPIISPRAEIEGFLRNRQDVPGFGVRECFLMLQTGYDLPTLQEQMQVRRESFPLPAFLGKRPLYVIDGERPISLVEKVCGAPVSADALEVAIAMGARHLFFFGICGGIGDGVRIGDIIVPTEIKREEGTSFHYLPEDGPATPDERDVRALTQFMDKCDDVRVHYGPTVSTDGVFRQTLNKERAWRQQGILGVDMEMSALLAVGKFHKLPAVCLLVVSDTHILEEKGQWHWGGQDLVRSRARAISLFVEFIRTTNTT